MKRALTVLLALSASVAEGAAVAPSVGNAAQPAWLNVTPIRQIYSLDCEAAALQMALQGVGISTNQDALITLMGADTRAPVMGGGSPVRWGDPYQTFVGDVRGAWLRTGYGAYFPPITAAAQASGAAAIGGQGWQPAQLYAEVASGHPVVVLAPHLMYAETVRHWTAWDGRSVWYSPQDHAQVLIGYDRTAATVTLADPLDGKIHTYAMALFEARFAGFGGQAVAVRPPDGPAPVVTSRTGNQAIFWKGGDNGLWEAWNNGGGWTRAVELPAASLASAPSAAVTAAGQQIVFWEGTDRLLHEMWWQSGQWSGPVIVDGGLPIDSRPSVLVTPRTQAQAVFWRSPDGGLESAWFQAGRWNGPVSVAGASGMLSPPSAINATGGDQAVFWQGSDGKLAEAWWTAVDVTWHGPVNPGGGMPVGSSPSAALTADGQQIVFWQGSDDSLQESWWSPRFGWSGPSRYGFASPRSSPSVDTDSAGQQHVFWEGDDGNIWVSNWSSGAWSTPTDLMVGPIH